MRRFGQTSNKERNMKTKTAVKAGVPKKIKFVPGMLVKSRTTVAEANFNGMPRWIHAEPGDHGEVTGVTPGGFPVIRFHKSGTETVAVPSEVML